MKTAITLIIVVVLSSCLIGFNVGKHVGERIGAKYCNILGED